MKALIVLFFIFLGSTTFAQIGTYRFANQIGASCTIAVDRDHSKISIAAFSWWHDASGRNGTFSGEGKIMNNTCVLKGQEDTDCTVALTFGNESLKVQFNDCMASNLPEDFSGTYKKLTNHLPGKYIIVPAKAYFFKSASSKNRLKTYLIRNNEVKVDLENITNATWVFVNYTNANGKTTNGYLQWSDLKIKK